MLPTIQKRLSRNEHQRQWAADGGSLILLAVLTILVFWKITLTGQFTWADLPDFVNQVLPWLQEQARQWQSGEFPVWDSRHWAGYPFVGQTQPGVLFPLNWLLAWMPMENGQLKLTWLNWYFAAIHYLGAVAAYALCRQLRCSRPASILGGITFGLGGFVGNTGWPQMINGAIFAPLVLLFLFRMADGARPILNAGISGALLGLSLWSGHHQVPMFIGLSAILLFAFIGASGKLGWRMIATCAGAFGLMAILIGAPQLLPGREFYMNALRWVNTQNPVTWKDQVPYSAHIQFSLSPGQLPGLIVPLWHGNVVLYVGVAVAGLAAFAIYRTWHLFATRYCALLGLVFLVFSFGANMPLHGMMYVLIPDLDKSRNIAFGVSMVHVALTMLAAIGLDAVRARWEVGDRYVRVAGWIAAGLSCALYVVILVMSVIKADAHTDPLIKSASITALAAGLFAGVLLGAWAGRFSSGIAITALLGLVLLETGTMTGSTYRHREHGWNFLNKLSADEDIAEFLRKRSGYTRITYNRDELPYNFGDWYGLDTTDGYLSPLTSVFRFSHAHDGALMSAAYRIAKAPRFEGQPLLFQGKSGLNVYQEPDPFPRAWSVHQVTSGRTEEEIRQFLNLPRVELRKAAIVSDDAPKVETCEDGDQVTIRRMTPVQIEINASMKCAGVVVLSNAYFPGWRATVDGRREPVHRAYGFLQAVRVERGEHRIEFRYVPTILYVGFAMAACGLLALTGIATFTRW